MKSAYTTYGVGWKASHVIATMTERKKANKSFLASIVIAFLIIVLVSQLLSTIDRSVTSPLIRRDLTTLNPFDVIEARAAEKEAIKMIQSHREINIVRGSGFTFKVGFKNNSSRSWYQKGDSRVELKLAPPYDRDTLVRHKFWRDSNTPAWGMETKNKPGTISFYRFALQAPEQSGIYTEKFALVRNNTEVIPGSEFEVIMNVWDSPNQFPKKGNTKYVYNNQKITPKSTAPVTSNKSTEQLKAEKLGHLALQEKIRQCGQLILNGTYRAASTELTEECAELGIHLTDESDNSDPFVVPQNPTTTTSTPLANSNTTTTSDTTSTSQLSNVITVTEPIMRVGIYYSDELITVRANRNYMIRDKNNVSLGSVSAQSVTSVVYNPGNRMYAVKVNGETINTSSYVRFEPVSEGTVFEVTSFESRPAWNPSINDNKFLGKLEVRHNDSKNRTWVINELPMETYLKGLAESTNYSPIEYQKALLVAARTYATYHYNKNTKHADEFFTVDAKYDQVYKGYNAQERLTKVTEAVESTKGQIVTYEGKLAITPYFSHSDGRTRSWSEVWGGDVPWAVSVKEPEGYDRTTLYGHGVGMSARGALLLDREYGYTYDEILKYYFTGVELADNYNNFQ